MISFQEYVKEELEQPINEDLILFGLMTAVLTHFGVRAGKKVMKHLNNFWDWACGEKKLTTTAVNDSLLEGNDEPKFDKNKAQPAMVDSEETLQKVIEATKALAKKKQGFYIFDELLKETPELKNINKAPYFPNYVIFMDAGDKDNEDQKPNFYGILGFSLKYWKTMAKKSKDQKIKEAAKKYTKYINIFAVQTEPKYAKQGLFEVYINSMKKAVKEAKMDGLTIKGDNKDLNKLYEKYGFKTCDDLEGYMALTLNEKKKKYENTKKLYFRRTRR